jgi:hypothetical protein
MITIRIVTLKLLQIQSRLIKLAFLLPLVMICIVLIGCQSGEAKPSSTDAPIPQSTGESQEGTTPGKPEEKPTPTPDPKDPEVIQTMWEGSPHANTFVVSDAGENNTCSSCHSRYNYIPAIDDIPEECFACKFEVDDPEPYIEEKYWVHVDCLNCHRPDKKKVDPAIAWLEFALIEEYSEVSSVTELCDKCHLASDVNQHFSIVVGGDHPEYECTECHNAHDTTASCSASGCHEGTLSQDPAIPGHDEDHTSVTCVACHDADKLDIGFIEELGVWTTLSISGDEPRAFTSHNIVLDAPCERCHFAENPWGFSENVESQ